MTDYKTEVTLNERDSLQDVLNAEKSLCKVYTTAITEGVSKGFRRTVIENLKSALDDQFKAFALMTECGYYEVETAPRESVLEVKENFIKRQCELS